jgi:hypothetical protein
MLTALSVKTVAQARREGRNFALQSTPTLRFSTTLGCQFGKESPGYTERESGPPPPTGPEAVQQNPQQPVAAVEAQTTRRVLLENRKLVAKREDLRL